MAFTVPAVVEGGSRIDSGIKSGQEPGAIAFSRKERLNILCLGVDYDYDRSARHYTRQVRSDAIFVVSLDRRGETLNVVSIPGDLRVDLPGMGEDKINAAYANSEKGDLKLARATVEGLLGIRIDHTVVIRAHGVRAVVDAIGGVTVDVEKDTAWDDNSLDLHLHLRKGVQRLDGRQAVEYVRFLQDEEGDRGRIHRQQKFLDALVRELKKPRYGACKEIARMFKEHVQTDLTLPQMRDIANIYRSFDRKRMRTARIDGVDIEVNGTFCILADETETRRIVSRLLMDHDDEVDGHVEDLLPPVPAPRAPQ